VLSGASAAAQWSELLRGLIGPFRHRDADPERLGRHLAAG